MDNLLDLSRKDKAFQVMFSENDRNRLDSLSRELEISRSLIIRRAIQNLWAMTIAKQALCANGTPCLVPQMHTPNANTDIASSIPPVPAES